MKQIKTILFAFGCSFLLSGTKAFAQVERLPDEASYPVLQELAGVETPAVLLSGTWQFQYSPDSKWDKIQVCHRARQAVHLPEVVHRPGRLRRQAYDPAFRRRLQPCPPVCERHVRPRTSWRLYPLGYGCHPLRPSRKEKRDSPRSDGSPGRYFLCLRLCPSSDRGNPARCNLVRITRNLLV